MKDDTRGAELKIRSSFRRTHLQFILQPSAFIL